MADASLEAIRRRAIDAPPPRDFFAALSSAASPPAIVAEIKSKSPSGGILRADFSPSAAAKQYCDNGAACLSVLTDAPFFGGDDSHLQQARAACPLPVLRKDFMLDEWQIYESRALGADAILLIAAILPPPTMQAMAALASRLGMAALAEAHNEKEMLACLATPAADGGNQQPQFVHLANFPANRLGTFAESERSRAACRRRKRNRLAHRHCKIAGGGRGRFLNRRKFYARRQPRRCFEKNARGISAAFFLLAKNTGACPELLYSKKNIQP